jgi:hypothetical protein
VFGGAEQTPGTVELVEVVGALVVVVGRIVVVVAGIVVDVVAGTPVVVVVDDGRE